mmetsp:Transcript_4820/g.13899  ORF Transcript_4820/g.13899 Transcript_4820/m.13899 type:complete len:294 (+) Transcript_4820:304-1185(+)
MAHHAELAVRGCCHVLGPHDVLRIRSVAVRRVRHQGTSRGVDPAQHHGRRHLPLRNHGVHLLHAVHDERDEGAHQRASRGGGHDPVLLCHHGGRCEWLRHSGRSRHPHAGVDGPPRLGVGGDAAGVQHLRDRVGSGRNSHLVRFRHARAVRRRLPRDLAKIGHRHERGCDPHAAMGADHLDPVARGATQSSIRDARHDRNGRPAVGIVLHQLRIPSLVGRSDRMRADRVAEPVSGGPGAAVRRRRSTLDGATRFRHRNDGGQEGCSRAGILGRSLQQRLLQDIHSRRPRVRRN